MSKEEYISIVTEELASLNAQKIAAQKRLDHLNQINDGDNLLPDIYRERHNIMLLDMRINFLEQVIQSEAYYRIQNMSDVEARLYIDAKISSLDKKIITLEGKINEAKAKYEQLTSQQIALIERYSHATDEAERQAITEESTRVQEELHLYDEFFDGNVISKYRKQIEKLKKAKAKATSLKPNDVKRILMGKFSPKFVPDERMEIVFDEIHDDWSSERKTFDTFVDHLFENVQNDPEKALELCGLLYDYYNFRTRDNVKTDERSFSPSELASLRRIFGDVDVTTLSSGRLKSAKESKEYDLHRYESSKKTLMDVLERLPLKEEDVTLLAQSEYASKLGLRQLADSRLSYIEKLYKEIRHIEGKRIKFSKEREKVRENYRQIDLECRYLVCELIDKIFGNPKTVEVMFGGPYPKYEEWKRLPQDERYEQAETFLRGAMEDFKKYSASYQDQAESEIDFISQMQERTAAPKDAYRADIIRRIQELAGPNFSLEDLQSLEGKGRKFTNGVRTIYGHGWGNFDLDMIMSFAYYRVIMKFADERSKEKAAAKGEMISQAKGQEEYSSEYAKLIEELASNPEIMDAMDDPTIGEGRHR